MSTLVLCRFDDSTCVEQVNVEIIQSPVPFPAVTVCNTGHLDMLVVDHIEQFFEGEEQDVVDSSLSEFFDKYTGFQNNVTSLFRHYPDNIHGRKTQDMIEVSSRLGLVANVGPRSASSAGIKAVDFIIQCQFLSKKCNVTRSFLKYFDSYYFNCFTFNPQVGSPSCTRSRYDTLKYYKRAKQSVNHASLMLL